MRSSQLTHPDIWQSGPIAESREGFFVTDGIDFGASFLEDVRPIDESRRADLSVLAYHRRMETKAEIDLRHDARQDIYRDLSGWRLVHIT